MRHIHLRNDASGREVQVACDSAVCWAIGRQLGNRTTDEVYRSPFVRRALANELPAKETVQR